MTIQITVRLDDENVKYADDLVAAGKAKSRADVVDRALKRERRRQAIERDAQIYATTPDDPEMGAWVAWTSANPVAMAD